MSISAMRLLSVDHIRSFDAGGATNERNARGRRLVMSRGQLPRVTGAKALSRRELMGLVKLMRFFALTN